MPQPRKSRSAMRERPRVVRDLHQRRLALGLTQQELADLARISRATVQAIESGQATVRLSSVLSIAEVLGYSIVAVSRVGAERVRASNR